MLHASYFTLSYFVVVREARGRRVQGTSFFRILRGMRLTQLFASAPFPLPSLLPSLRVVSFPDTTHFLCSARRTCQTEAGSFASARPSARPSSRSCGSCSFSRRARRGERATWKRRSARRKYASLALLHLRVHFALVTLLSIQHANSKSARSLARLSHPRTYFPHLPSDFSPLASACRVEGGEQNLRFNFTRGLVRRIRER